MAKLAEHVAGNFELASAAKAIELVARMGIVWLATMARQRAVVTGAV